MPYTTVTSGAVLTASHFNSNYRDQVVTQCVAASKPTPVDGMVSSVTDTDSLEVHNGSTWITALGYGDWLTYTPALVASGGGLAGGTGAVTTGRYQRMGNTVHFRARIAFGSSGMSAGTGYYTVSLPVACDATFQCPIGVVHLGDTSAPRYYVALLLTTGQMITHDNASLVGAAVPFTWAANDYLEVAGTYEV